MPRKQHVVRLSAADRQTLHQMIRTGRRSAAVLQRARILLQTDAGHGGPGLTDAEVAAAVDVATRTVARVRASWCARGWDALERKARATPPTPPILDAAGEARLVAIACSTPPDGRSQWSLRLLTDRAVVLELAPAISHETVRRVLKKTVLRLGVSSAS